MVTKNRIGDDTDKVVEGVTYKIKDGKRKAVFAFTAATFMMGGGAALLIDGILAGDPILMAAGAASCAASVFIFYKINRDTDEHLDNFTKGFFAEPSK